MTMTVTINKLEIENVKRIKAVKIEPSPKGLTIIGGNNNQGKTSVLDSIAWALGGGRYEPSKPMREGSAVAPTLKVTMSNGLIVERKGVNSALKVIDPDGRKAGQQLLNSFVEELAINLPKFMDGTPKEKADTLLQIIGVGDQLVELELKEKEVYNQRHAIGVIADQKEKFAKEQPYFTDAPKELISISELIQQQQTILAKNGENAQKRTRVEQIRYEYDQSIIEVDRLRKLLAEAEAKTEQLSNDLKIANTDVMELHDQSTAEIEDNIAQIDEINRKVRANLDKDKAEEDAKQQREQYALLSTEIEHIRQAKRDLLTNANLKEVYNQRHAIGVIADQKEKFAKEQPYFTDAPKELISISKLIQQQQTILAKNGENAQKRTRVEQIRYEYDQSIIEVDRLRKLLAEAEAKTKQLSNDLKIANTDAMELHDQSTAEIEDNIAQIDEINRKVRANFDKDKAEEDAKQYRDKYEVLSNDIEEIRQAKRDLLTNANLPLDGLSVDDGKLLYQGQEWDNMSGSQQLMVATAIVRKLKPNCGFVLIDKLEQMDNNTLQEFGAWLEQEGLQAIATRVSTGDECSIIIEDGYSIENTNHQPVSEPKKWDF